MNLHGNSFNFIQIFLIYKITFVVKTLRKMFSKNVLLVENVLCIKILNLEFLLRIQFYCC